MFFLLSKIVFFIIAPSHLCLIALGSGIILLAWETTQRLARWLLMISFTAFVVLGFSPIGNSLIFPLEERFPATRQINDGEYAGIIFLGGFEDGAISTARNKLALVDSAERLTETLRLALQLPSAKIVFTGGSNAILGAGDNAKQAIGDYLESVGVKKDRLILETNARNTWENAMFTLRELKPKDGERFLLVTSAWHMPRAMGVFRQAGYDVDAYPVDYRTSGRQDLSQPFSFMTNGLQRTDNAVKEWIGLIVYWATRRSNEFFPSP